LREVFGTVLDVFASTRVTCFKVGLDVYGLLRPDKMVAYFDTIEQLQVTTELLTSKLAGCPAHGVPFTAEITGDGLLSWGIDPPHDLQALSWLERESWRLWLTNRLATALLAAKSAQSTTIAPWEFALGRIALEGVDIATWTPTRQFEEKFNHNDVLS
jgi:hypothetical protein